MTDVLGTIEYANPRLAELAGSQASKLTGASVSEIGRVSGEQATRIWEALRVGRSWEGNLEFFRSDGDRYWVLATVTPVKERQGAVRHFIGLGRIADRATIGADCDQAMLSSRELQVLELIGQGCDNRSISRTLEISHRTVGHHVTHILRKLGSRNRAGAIAMAHRRGVLGVTNGHDQGA